MSLEECLVRNIRVLEYLHDRLEGHIQIIIAISLVVNNFQVAIKRLIQNVLHTLREKRQDIRNRIANCNDKNTVLRNVPLKPLALDGDEDTCIITAEQIEVLRSTGMQWTAIANCLGVGAHMCTYG